MFVASAIFSIVHFEIILLYHHVAVKVPETHEWNEDAYHEKRKLESLKLLFIVLVSHQEDYKREDHKCKIVKET